MRTVSEEIAGLPLPLLVSAVIPEAFAHGFTTRAGGVSAPPYHTLNFGRSWGDAAQAVQENRRRLLARAGASGIFLAAQVHGAEVAQVRAGQRPEEIAAVRADAVCTDVPGAAAAVIVADCVPLVMADPRTGACAAVHAGWRGVVSGAATAALERLQAAYGSAPGDVRVAIGPSIGPCCFEVGPEVVAAFERAFPFAAEESVVVRAGTKPHVDLPRTLRAALVRAGVAARAIDIAGVCTRCDPDGRFYSYRRDANKTGQQLGFVARR